MVGPPLAYHGLGDEVDVLVVVDRLLHPLRQHVVESLSTKSHNEENLACLSLFALSDSVCYYLFLFVSVCLYLSLSVSDSLRLSLTDFV